MSGKVGIIGGSGFYNIDGIKDIKNISVKTPFGAPSGEFITGVLEGKEVVFLARHDKGHRILPGEINYRANIYGMKKLGVERIISVSACGSLKEELKPLDIVVPLQFVDRTNYGRRMVSASAGYLYGMDFGRGYAVGALGGAIAGGLCIVPAIALSVLLADTDASMLAVGTGICILTGGVGGAFGQMAAFMRRLGS